MLDRVERQVSCHARQYNSYKHDEHDTFPVHMLSLASPDVPVRSAYRASSFSFSPAVAWWSAVASAVPAPDSPEFRCFFPAVLLFLQTVLWNPCRTGSSTFPSFYESAQPLLPLICHAKSHIKAVSPVAVCMTTSGSPNSTTIQRK